MTAHRGPPTWVCLILCVVTLLFSLVASLSIVSCNGSELCSDPPECPHNCICKVASDNTSLSLDCGGHPSPNISQELEDYLSDPRFARLQDLTVVNSTLSNIPPALCSLQDLTRMNLSFNKITTLDPECFSNMTQLVSLDIETNQIQQIPDGLFQGLQKLASINLADNWIEKIGLHVFSNRSDLLSLQNVILSHNRLATLDPWPLIRVLARPGIYIEIEHNLIEEFTDRIGWSYNCDSGTLKGTLSLKSNQLHRLSNFIHGWQFKYEIDVWCMFTKKGSDMRIALHENSYICDCLEYSIIKYLRSIGKKSHIINELKCHSPPFPGMISDPPMRLVPLEQLICNLTKTCPGGCTCIERPDNKTIHYLCHYRRLSDLPTQAPLPLADLQYQYKVEFDHNDLTVLEDREYFHNTTIADVSHNKIREIRMAALFQLENASAIYLHENNLTTLPQAVQNLTFTASQISFYSNKWVCDCKTLWLKHWFLTLNASLVNPEGILCDSPGRVRHSNMLKLPDSQFICGDPPNTQLRNLIIIAVSSIVGTILVFVTPLAVIYALRVVIYKHLNWHPFDWDECEGEEKRYDVFISYAEEDKAWVMQQVNLLEQVHNFTCCLHQRDFVPGARILDQIGYAIEYSKRTLCVLSPHFIKSEFCTWEFSHAFHEDVRNKRRRLLALRLADFSIDDPEDKGSTIQQYISTFTYLDAEDPKFEEKLLYALPVHKVADQPTAPDLPPMPGQGEDEDGLRESEQEPMEQELVNPCQVGDETGDTGEIINHRDHTPLLQEQH